MNQCLIFSLQRDTPISYIVILCKEKTVHGMNNKNFLCKTCIFKWIPILFFIVPLFVTPSCAYVSNNDIKIHIFDDKVADFEAAIFESLQTTKNVWAKMEPAIALGELLAMGHPVTAAIAGVVSVLQSMLAKESDWKGSFAKAIATESDRSKALEKVTDMKQLVRAIKQKFPVLSDKNPHKESRITYASDVHTIINFMLNVFDGNDSIFRQLPLIGAPLLLLLSQLVVLFEPFIKKLNPFEAKYPELSCKVRNILLDYRPRTVNARLEQMHLESHVVKYEHFLMLRPSFEFSQCLNQVMGPANFNASISTTDHVFCNKGCSPSMRKSIRFVAVNDGELHSGLCMKDDFGRDEYSFYKLCIKGYATLLRRRVEELFYVDLLNKLCVDPPKKTGTVTGLITATI